MDVWIYIYISKITLTHKEMYKFRLVIQFKFQTGITFKSTNDTRWPI